MNAMHEIDIHGLAFGGGGVGRLEGKVCFVDYSLPGEKVRFFTETEKKRFVKGRAAEIITASPDRVEPPCPYYGSCGGCQYQHLSYEKELFYKGEQVKGLLARVGGFKEYDFEGMAASPSPYGYRSSVTLHRTGGGYGYYARDNKSVIKIDSCSLAVDPINRTLAEDAGREAAVSLLAQGRRDDVTLKCDYSDRVWITDFPDHRFFKDKFLDTEMFFSPRAFSQANREVAVAMVSKLRRWMSTGSGSDPDYVNYVHPVCNCHSLHNPGLTPYAVLFDLYCGAGFFAFLLRDMFDAVISVDGSGIAVDCARATKKALAAAKTKFYKARVEEKFPVYFERSRGERNIILLDPGRTGIDGKLAAYLSEIRDPAFLCYISCDPSILARDAKRLTANGRWRLDRVACFDMFPRTKHIETIAAFAQRVGVRPRLC